MDEVKSDTGKSLKKRYPLIALWCAIVGAAPLIFSLLQIASSAGVSKDTLGYPIEMLAFSAWLFVSLPFSFFVGIATISFAGYALKFPENNQVAKAQAQIALVVGCLDLLIPIAIFIFFLMPIFPGVKGG